MPVELVCKLQIDNIHDKQKTMSTLNLWLQQDTHLAHRPGEIWSSAVSQLKRPLDKAPQSSTGIEL